MIQILIIYNLSLFQIYVYNMIEKKKLLKIYREFLFYI